MVVPMSLDAAASSAEAAPLTTVCRPSSPRPPPRPPGQPLRRPCSARALAALQSELLQLQQSCLELEKQLGAATKESDASAQALDDVGRRLKQQLQAHAETAARVRDMRARIRGSALGRRREVYARALGLQGFSPQNGPSALHLWAKHAGIP